MVNRKKKATTQLGKQPSRYRFFLNPYQDMRWTRCPQCDNKMHQRKLPLVIHVDPMQVLSLNETCRYCPHCDLLIAHQDDVEHFLERNLTPFGLLKWFIVVLDAVLRYTQACAPSSDPAYLRNWHADGMKGEWL